MEMDVFVNVIYNPKQIYVNESCGDKSEVYITTLILIPYYGCSNRAFTVTCTAGDPLVDTLKSSSG